jgi:hypothetical protein
VRVWAAAGIAGAAVGPAVGGLLTQLISWQSIFVVQIPLALIPALVVVSRGAPVVATRAGLPHIAANLALGLLSAGLAAVFFLLVLLLVEGWRMPPISAALVVTVIPAAAAVSGPFERRVASPRTRAAAGTLLGVGGVAALGLLPGAGWAWTLAPQLLVGTGLALSLGALTEAALAGRSPAAIHGGYTIAARHAGVVLGLVLLTPVFVADLDRQRDRATQKGAELVLDARIGALTKVDLASRIASDIRRQPGRLPDITAHIRAAVIDGDEIWSEWEMTGTRPDGKTETLRGVIIFGVTADRMDSSRFYLEPVDAGSDGHDGAVDRLVGDQVAGSST